MAKGKKKGKRRGGDSTTDEDEEKATQQQQQEGSTKQLSRKEKRLQKLQAKQHEEEEEKDYALLLPTRGNDYGNDDDNSEEEVKPAKKLTKKQQRRLAEREAAARAKQAEAEQDDEESSGTEKHDEEESSEESKELPQPAKKLTKKQLKTQREREAAKAEEEDKEDEESETEDEEEPPPPVKKLTKKQLKKLQEKEAAAVKAQEEEFDSHEETEEELTEKVDELRIVDSDDDDGKEKKKKKKKEKKKSKLEKQMEEAHEKKQEEEEEQATSDDDDGVLEHDTAEEDEDDMDEEAKAKAARKAEKAARKAEKEAKRARKAEKAAKKAAKAAKEEHGDDEEDKKEGDEEHEVFYGAPDEAAWSDLSHAQREAATKAKEGPDLSLVYGPDGKKLSNKERKRALKAKQAAERAAEYEISAAKASAEGAQFACSQTAINENDPQWENSLDINIPNFSISAAGKILFKDATLTVGHGRRYGLVGPNGKGKSTLLKMIASRDLILPPRIDFLYVEQEVVADDTPAVDAVLKADKKRWALLEEEKVLMEAVDAGDEDPKKVERLQQVFDELNQMGADGAEAKARRILYGLGFDIEMQTKPTKMFSGGWRMRISLARALFMEPTLLMLDEPTNHLDLNAVIWLDDYMQRWKKTLLIVSHDQDFLNSLCQEILHIEDLKLISYKGDYDSFKKAEKTKFKQQVKAWEKQEKRLRELKRSGQSKAKATENVKKSSKREPGARSAKKKSDAIASGTATAETTELIKRPREYHVKLEFAEVAELSRPVMEVNRVNFRYSPKHPVIFNEIDFGIDMDSRICVVGPNGAGKTTLLKLLTGEVKATEGEVRRNPRLRMGIYNQHFVDRLPMSKTPVEHLRDRFNDEEYQSIRNRLGKYGLEGHAHEVAMRDLSGGQKARVVFVELSLQRPHILLLDEPTNNLDVETIDALVDAINEFNGGIVVVTHDQRLIEQCECTLWVVEKQGVTKWDAGFDDYKETLLQEMEEQVEREAAARKEKLEAAAAARAEKLARLQAKIKK